MENVSPTLLGAVALFLGGSFALVRYIVSEMGKVNRSFLEYIEKKNGQMERVAERFDATATKFDETLQQFIGNQRTPIKKRRYARR